MKFEIKHTDKNSNARRGLLHTGHGTIPTPVFMPVGTAGTVKAITRDQLVNTLNAPIILGNTYHLFLRPGMDTIRKAGGLHQFIGWDRALLTDSGGYQVFSLSQKRKIKDDGVKFQSHIDGSYHFFTPESAIDIQRSIGADIIMAFDECTPYPCDFDYAEKSMHLTHQWLDRCLARFQATSPLYGFDQAMLPIVQGSVYNDLRKKSAEYVANVAEDGCAIGGLSVGEPAEIMYEMTETVCHILPKDKPRYLMGVGTPVNLLECIDLGIDMFDCVMPTRNARNGMLFTSNGIINIRNKKWANDFSPIDATLPSAFSNEYSRAYLRHLVISGEMLGATIASIHNLEFYLWLMRKAQQMIEKDEFKPWKNKMVKNLANRL